MKDKNKQFLDELFERYPRLSHLREDLVSAFTLLMDSFTNEGKLLIVGNGGGASDCDHICGEFIKDFLFFHGMKDEEKAVFAQYGEQGAYCVEKLQDALPAIPLSSYNAGFSAMCNDTDANLAFAQLVMALGRKNDVLWVFSAGGNSVSSSYAIMAAKAKGMKVLTFSGKGGGKVAKLADVAVVLPEMKDVYKIQEEWFPLYHALCIMIEEEVFGK